MIAGHARNKNLSQPSSDKEANRIHYIVAMYKRLTKVHKNWIKKIAISYRERGDTNKDLSIFINSHFDFIICPFM